jgi:thymidylate synthase (FAD)
LFSFQEFSQRYSQATDYIASGARRQDMKNRQNSIDDIDPESQKWFQEAQAQIWSSAYGLYEEALNRGIAKECARALLPLGTATRIYMNGTIRSWIHYIQLRTQPSTQFEHRVIAEECKAIFTRELPLISKALGW